MKAWAFLTGYRSKVAFRSKRMLMRLVRPWAPFIPEQFLRQIPVVGRVGISLPNGHRVRLKTDGYDYVTSSLYWNGLGGYEPGTIRLFLRLLSQADVFIDIGANTGLFALMAVRGRLRPRRIRI